MMEVYENSQHSFLMYQVYERDVLLVVQEVVSQVIADVAKYSTTKYSRRSIPVVKEDCMCELVERSRESDEEGRRHDKTVSVHGEVVVDAMEEEVCCYADSVVG